MKIFIMKIKFIFFYVTNTFRSGDYWFTAGLSFSVVFF